MGKRKSAESSDEDDDNFAPARATGSNSPERPLVQTARRSGKKAKVQSESEEESEEEVVKPVKRAKKTKATSSKPASIKKPKITLSDDDVEEADNAGDVKVGVSDRGERFVDLGKKKRATVNTFKGGRYLDIREFYGDEGDLKPGKKGISINEEQWATLKKAAPIIDSFFAKLKK